MCMLIRTSKIAIHAGPSGYIPKYQKETSVNTSDDMLKRHEIMVR